jgi:hypothetical protein
MMDHVDGVTAPTAACSNNRNPESHGLRGAGPVRHLRSDHGLDYLIAMSSRVETGGPQTPSSWHWPILRVRDNAGTWPMDASICRARLHGARSRLDQVRPQCEHRRRRNL